MVRVVFILLLAITSSCESSKPVPPKQAASSTTQSEPKSADADLSEEDRLIQQLIEGGPEEKMAAARGLERLNSKKSVPYLLEEARDNYPKIYYGTGGTNAHVIQDGKKVPYVDYHEPLFSALSTIAVPYFGNDEKWFAAIDEWIEEDLSQVAPDKSLKPKSTP